MAEVLPLHSAREAVATVLQGCGFTEALTQEQALSALRGVWPAVAAALPPEVAEAWLERAARDLHVGGHPPPANLSVPSPSSSVGAEDLALRFALIRAEALRGSQAKLDLDPAAPGELRLLARHAAEVAVAEVARLRAEHTVQGLRGQHARAEIAAEYHLALLRRDALRAALADPRSRHRALLIHSELTSVESIIRQLADLGLAPHLPVNSPLPDLDAAARSALGQLVCHPQALLARQEVQRAELRAARQPEPQAQAVLRELEGQYRAVLSALSAGVSERLNILRRHAEVHAELGERLEPLGRALAHTEAAGDLAVAAQARFEQAQLRAARQVETHRLTEGLALLDFGAAR